MAGSPGRRKRIDGNARHARAPGAAGVMSGTRAYFSKSSPLILWVWRTPLFQEALAGVPALILWVWRVWATPWAGGEVVRVILGRVLPGSMCGNGPVGAVLHIRSGPVASGSAESCGNASILNAVEILPCAERAPLHMGAHPLKIDILGRIPESCGKLRIGPRGRRSPMCNTPATGSRRTRPRPLGSAATSPRGARATIREPDPAPTPWEIAPPGRPRPPSRRPGEKDPLRPAHQDPTAPKRWLPRAFKGSPRRLTIRNRRHCAVSATRCFGVGR